VNKLVYN